MKQYITLPFFLITAAGFADMTLRKPEPPSLAERTWVNRPESPVIPERKHRILISDLRGIALFGSMSSLKTTGLDEVSGVKAYDLDLPGGENGLQNKLKPYLNQPLTDEKIMEIKRAIVLYYADESRPVVMVQLLEQDLSSGVLSLLVTESKLGAIKSKGCRWTKDQRLIDSVRLEPGNYIDQEVLEQDLEWMNRNPFRRTSLIYAPGEKAGTTDIELVTDERRQIRFYSGAENSGLNDIGPDRYFVGFNWANAFNFGHILSFQYTTADSLREFQQGTVHYTAPLSWRHTLVIYGGYASVYAKPMTDFVTAGHSLQGSFRYEIPFRPFGRWLNQVTFGFDLKRSNNTVAFSDNPTVGQLVNLTQFELGYNVSFESTHNQLFIYSEILFSPFKWLPNQSNTAFETLRMYAKNKWIYGQLYITDHYTIPGGFILYGSFRGQLSSANLLPSEEFGLGGQYTVRGYHEREIIKDNAILTNAEIRSPYFSVLHKYDGQMQFLAFFDYGIGKDHHLLPYEKHSQYLMSVGPGWRYNIKDYFIARLDYGYRLHRDKFAGGRGRLHFGVTVSY